MVTTPSIALSDGVDRRHDDTPGSPPPSVRIPLLGLGTWQARGEDAYGAVRAALEVGYRHIDTATVYRNEKAVGEAIRDSGLARSEVFITTKLPAENAGRERRTLEESLSALGVEQLDLWLIHSPPGRRAGAEVWRQLIAAREGGLTLAIGVSNYSIAQIDELVEATGVAPAANQILWHVERYDPAVVAAHAERDVVLEGYSPFKHTKMSAPPLADAAAAHGKTPQQVVLRWHLQHGIVVIPKSAHRDRIASNFDVFDFELSPAEMAAIDGLGTSRGRERRR
jgi:2,5-diketo-D-gluconate reductase A